MAHILEGRSDLKLGSPVSHGTVLELCRYLHGLHLDTTKQLQVLRAELGQVGSQVTKFASECTENQRQHGHLKREVGVLSTSIGEIKAKLAEQQQICGRLECGVTKACEGVDYLREGQKITNTNVHSLKEDIDLGAKDLKAVRDDLEEHVQRTFVATVERLNTGLMTLGLVERDMEKARYKIQKHDEQLHSIGVSLGALQEHDAGKLGELVAHLEATSEQTEANLKHTTNQLRETTANLEMSNAVVLRMHEGLQATKADVSELQLDVRHTLLIANKVETAHAQTAKSHLETKAELHQTTAATEQIRHVQKKVMDDFLDLRTAQGRCGDDLAAVARDVAKVQMMASVTQDNLDATSCILLPNLPAEAIAPLGVASRMAFGSDFSTTGGTTTAFGSLGSSRPGTSGPPPGSASTPRKKRDAQWHARKIGIVPDRMSWI